MKKIILSAFVVLLTCSGFAQTNSYDSLSNFLGKDVEKYVGQVLFLKKNNAAKVNNGYQGFAKEPNFDLGANGRNVYLAAQSKVPLQYVTTYDMIAEHYFKVANVVSHPVKAFTRQAISHFIQLVDMTTGNTCYYGYDATDESSFSDFIVVGYYEKQQDALIGKSFIYTGKEPVANRPAVYLGLQDMSGKGQRKDIKAGSEWTCADVVIEDVNRFEMIAELENPLYGKVYTLVTDLQKTSDKNAKFQTYADIKSQLDKAQKAEDERMKNIAAKQQDAIAKFGKQTGTLLASGEISVGMTEDMCRWVFGDPFSVLEVNDNGDKVEQWYYTNGRYLYFRKGILIKHTKLAEYKDDNKYYHNS